MKKTKLILLLCMTVVFVAAVALLAGCNVGGSYRYDYLVTFDYNVDGLGVPTNCVNQYLGVKDGDPVWAPGTLDGDNFKATTVNDYYNEGWYLPAEVDENGNPKKDDKGTVLLGQKWDFSTPVHENFTLYANFRKTSTLTVVVQSHDGSVKGTDLVITKLPGEQYTRPTTNSNKPQMTDYTFIDYYTDETYTTKFQFPYTFTDEDATCYALMLEGNWSVIKNAQNFCDALVSGRSMYFDVPNNVIDFKEDVAYLEDYCNPNNGYDGKIYGNGCVLKNIDLSISCGTRSTYSLFGNIGKNAEINDLTIQNYNFTFTVNGLANDKTQAALFATNIADGAKFDKLVFENCTLKYLGTSNFTIETYAYYVTCNEAHSCFDMEKLQVTNNIVPKTDN